MSVERGSGRTRGGRTFGEEPLDGEVIVRLKARGNIEGRDVVSGKGDLNFWAGGGLEGGLGSH